jgi:hypothetical protein
LDPSWPVSRFLLRVKVGGSYTNERKVGMNFPTDKPIESGSDHYSLLDSDFDFISAQSNYPKSIWNRGVQPYSIEVNPNNAVDFNVTKIINPSGDYATKYEWLFGDGGRSAAKETTHRYSRVGNYTVTLRVWKEFPREFVDPTSSTPHPKNDAFVYEIRYTDLIRVKDGAGKGGIHNRF